MTHYTSIRPPTGRTGTPSPTFIGRTHRDPRVAANDRAMAASAAARAAESFADAERAAHRRMNVAASAARQRRAAGIVASTTIPAPGTGANAPISTTGTNADRVAALDALLATGAATRAAAETHLSSANRDLRAEVAALRTERSPMTAITRALFPERDVTATVSLAELTARMSK